MFEKLKKYFIIKKEEVIIPCENDNSNKEIPIKDKLEIPKDLEKIISSVYLGKNIETHLKDSSSINKKDFLEEIKTNKEEFFMEYLEKNFLKPIRDLKVEYKTNFRIPILIDSYFDRALKYFKEKEDYNIFFEKDCVRISWTDREFLKEVSYTFKELKDKVYNRVILKNTLKDFAIFLDNINGTDFNIYSYNFVSKEDKINEEYYYIFEYVGDTLKVSKSKFLYNFNEKKDKVLKFNKQYC